MAERFGAQAHPSGGTRFGSQVYAAINAVSGSFTTAETGSDVFFADTQPSVHGAAALSESPGADVLSISGISSLLFTMQAHESPTPDSFIAAGRLITASLRFGSQVHPLGGVRFGLQSWAALGPNGPLAVAETGSDTVAAVGWLAGTSYSFEAFNILAEFVDYSSESLGAAITGTLDSGNKVMLPVAGDGVTLAWELNEFGNPSLRLALLTGATVLAGVPWYVWDGVAWTVSAFDVSDALQGAAFLTESGADRFVGNGSQTRYGFAELVEPEIDFSIIVGGVRVGGAMGSIEAAGSDAFAADGAPHYSGMLEAREIDLDVLDVVGSVSVLGALICSESGVDSFQSTGTRSVAGVLAASEIGSDEFFSQSWLLVKGVLTTAEAAVDDVFAGTAEVVLSGVLMGMESGVDALSAVGLSERYGVLLATESGADVIASGGSVAVSGALLATEEGDRFQAVGFRVFSGGLLATEVGADRFLARGLAKDLPPVSDFDGYLETESMTSKFTVKSRQQAAIA